MWDQTAGPATFLWIHPAVDAGDVLAGHTGNILDADFGNDGFGGIKMSIAHGRDICDNRDFKSRAICELRDRKNCGDREYAAMSDPQHELRTWLQQELAKRPHGTKGKLAKFIGVTPDMLSRILNTEPGKETRSIKWHELELMREFFAQDEHAAAALPPIRGEQEILATLQRIEGLSEKDIAFLCDVILKDISFNTASRQHNQAGGQSEPATPRRESSSSR